MALPPTLVDLTLARLCARPNASFQSQRGLARGLLSRLDARQLHQVATTSHDSAPSGYGSPIYSPSGYLPGGGHAFSGLLKKPRHAHKRNRPTEVAVQQESSISALKNAAKVEDPTEAPPAYTDDFLMKVYEDLLALPNNPTTPEPELEAGVDDSNDHLLYKSAVDGLALRLSDGASNYLANTPATTPLGRLLLQRHPPNASRISQAQLEYDQDLEAVRADSTPSLTATLSAGVVSPREWTALVRHCIHESDGPAAETAIDLMQRYGEDVPESLHNEILSMYAETGSAVAAESFIEKFCPSPSEKQRDLHVKAHLLGAQPETIPSGALAVLHSYESKSLVAPMRTYSRVLGNLFNLRTSIAHAQAWDLFTHMRYVAHPHPDVVLYTQMLRACAFPLPFVHTPKSRSEPERALDLWTEMTVDRGIAPTAASYAAVILACARSGRKVYVAQAFRLAKEMLDAHRDARGNAAFRPDEQTFCALLEGAKRMGDLGRARWILAEMARESERAEGAVRVTEEAMMHVFHAYAAYKPPFVRQNTVLVGEQAEPTGEETVEDVTEGPTALKETRVRSFSHIPPQSHSAVALEAESLLAQILEDTSVERHHEVSARFRDVQLTPRLLNSYLSVHFGHSSLEKGEQLWSTLFNEMEVPRNPQSYVDALERCARAKKGVERDLATSFAQSVWEMWVPLEQQWRAGALRFEARMVERANVAMIRTLALTNQVDRALGMIKGFVALYPPRNLRQPPAKPAMRATRTALLAQGRPIVRMISETDVPDDTVPPLLTFDDVEIVHHRLSAVGRKEDIAYVKWVCKAYEGALRRRRDAAMLAKPTELADEVDLRNA